MKKFVYFFLIVVIAASGYAGYSIFPHYSTSDKVTEPKSPISSQPPANNSNNSQVNNSYAKMEIRDFRLQNKTVEIPEPHRDSIQISVYSHNLATLSLSIIQPNGERLTNSGFSTQFANYFNTTFQLNLTYANTVGTWHYMLYLANETNSISEIINLTIVNRISANLVGPNAGDMDHSEKWSISNISGEGAITNTSLIFSLAGHSSYIYNQLMINFTPPYTGNLTVSAELTDSYGYHWTFVSTIMVNALNAGQIISKGVFRNVIDLGGNAEFYTLLYHVGTPPYHYNWFINNKFFSNGEMINVTFDAIGNYTINCTITDALGSTLSLTIKVQSIPDPTFDLVSAPKDVILNNIGGIANFKILATGGTGFFEATVYDNGQPVMYGWTDNSSNITLQVPDYIFKVGLNDMTFYLSDASGMYSTSLSTNVNYYTLSPSITAQNTISDSNSSDFFNSSMAYNGVGTGFASYTYTWLINGAVFSHNRSIDPVLYGVGIDKVTLTIVDSVNQSQSTTISIKMNPQLNLTLAYSEVPSQYGGFDVSIYANVTGGTYITNVSSIYYGYNEYYNVNFYAGSIDYQPYGSSLAKNLVLTVNYINSGKYTWKVTVSDGIGNTVIKYITVEVS